jgi:hypothetical protein
MRLSLLLLSALLLPFLSAASPTPVSSPALSARAPIISPPSATAPPSRRDDKFAPSILPLSLNLPMVSIAPPSRPSRPPFSLDLPPKTCTPGFSSYATPGLDGYVPAEACSAVWVYFPSFAAAVAFSIRHPHNRAPGSSSCVPQWLLLGHYRDRSLGDRGLCFPCSWLQETAILRHCNCCSDHGLGSSHLCVSS